MEILNDSQKLLSDIVVYTKYAKYLPEKKTRESWSEIVDRYMDMMVKKYPQLKDEIINNSSFIYDKKVLMSMRAAQFSGLAIEKNNSRVYNCAYSPVDHPRVFSEIMFLLLGGTGVGFSVQKKHIEKLPEILTPKKHQKFLISDSIEGWADAVKALVYSYYGMRKTKPKFDFSDIREKGERLVTAGGKAPGAEPLKKCLFNIETMLDRKSTGDKLKPIEVHDIVCHIADAVLAGGIRRAALISLFSADDDEMLNSKTGNWWELNPQRGRANNSVVLLRHRIKKDYFKKIWKRVEFSKAGEPGFYFSNNADWGTNPCCEIALRPKSFCNLTEINTAVVKTQEELDEASRVASFFGTLQAGITDFHYLSNEWKQTTEKDALIGVGMTGICSGTVLPLDLTKSAHITVEENKRVAKIIGINSSARVTTIKPSGSTSCVVGSSSGIHAWHSKFYIRNIQCSVGDELYNYFSENHPKLIKKMDIDPTSAVIGIPQKAPETAILRENETSIDMLERVIRFSKEWVREGHVSGDNTNNVSATVYIKDDEWDNTGEWLWKNRKNFNGISCFNYDGGNYTDTPFIEIDEKTYNKLYKLTKNVDITKIKEDDDNTDLSGEIACQGGQCEVSF